MTEDTTNDTTIALVTGANKGIGYAIAAGLGRTRLVPRPRARTTAIRLATLVDDGPTGRYFEDAGPIPW